MNILSTHDPRPNIEAALFFFRKMQSAEELGESRDFEYYAMATIVLSRSVWQVVNSAAHEYSQLKSWWEPLNDKLKKNRKFMAITNRRNMTLKQGKLEVSPNARLRLEGKDITLKAGQVATLRMDLSGTTKEFWFADAETGEEITGSRTQMKQAYFFVDSDVPIITEVAEFIILQQRILDEYITRL